MCLLLLRTFHLFRDLRIFRNPLVIDTKVVILEQRCVILTSVLSFSMPFLLSHPICQHRNCHDDKVCSLLLLQYFASIVCLPLTALYQVFQVPGTSYLSSAAIDLIIISSPDKNNCDPRDDDAIFISQRADSRFSPFAPFSLLLHQYRNDETRRSIRSTRLDLGGDDD